MVWHWNCASALCTNSWRTKGVDYYTLPSNLQLRREYSAILKNDNINWSKHVICSAHWTGGKRTSLDHIPDVSCPDSQFQKFKKLKKKNPKNVELEKKMSCAKRSREVDQQKRESRKRKLPVRNKSSPKKKKRRKSKSALEKDVNNLTVKCADLERERCLLEAKAAQQAADINKLHEQINLLQEKLQRDRSSFTEKIKHMKFELNKMTFSYECLCRKEKQFFYLCGLSVNEFQCLYECLEPFRHLIIYPDCPQNENSKFSNNKLFLDERSELMVALTIARHNVDLGIMAKMVGGSASSMSRIFVAWIVFIQCVFDSIDLKPYPGFIEAFLPKTFADAGYADCGILGDNTETWITQFENYDINNLTFSHYKNHTTGKVSVWIFPHGALCKCSDAYPGTISDEQLTAEIGVLDYCPENKVVMTDKGFAISDLCHAKGLHHNRPPMKFNSQYDENEVNINFDIATLRIYNENAIGRIRDWSILNACWPAGRVDLLGMCWIALAHVVNLTKKPVGPKE